MSARRAASAMPTSTTSSCRSYATRLRLVGHADPPHGLAGRVLLLLGANRHVERLALALDRQCDGRALGLVDPLGQARPGVDEQRRAVDLGDAVAGLELAVAVVLRHRPADA